MPSAKRVAVIVLDGCALGDPDAGGNAVAQAKKPWLNQYWPTRPEQAGRHISWIKTDEASVGLPEGQVGGSEVGHITLGAGRPIKHLLTKINEQIAPEDLAKNSKISALFAQAKANGRLHLVGMISDGGVHSYVRHLHGLQKFAKQAGIKDVFIHAITDGRDVGLHTALEYIKEVESQGVGKIVTISGRYFAMDRDHNWDRTQAYYQILTDPQPTTSYVDATNAVKAFYKSSSDSDYYLPPTRLCDEGVIAPDDVVINFNFRTDRMRQLSTTLTDVDFREFPCPVQIKHTNYGIFGNYCPGAIEPFRFSDEKRPYPDGLGEVLSRNNKTQLRLTETEKFNHVTFFFSLENPDAWPGETRKLIPSPKCSSYAEQPEMSAQQQTQALLKILETETPDFLLQNFANPDLVGHSGDLAAATKAVEVTDKCLSQEVPHLREKGYTIIFTADHGNADCMINPDGTPNASHTRVRVPLFILPATGDPYPLLEKGTLADVAPTVLSLLGIEIPKVMTGKNLIVDNG